MEEDPKLQTFAIASFQPESINEANLYYHKTAKMLHLAKWEKSLFSLPCVPTLPCSVFTHEDGINFKFSFKKEKRKRKKNSFVYKNKYIERIEYNCNNENFKKL